MMLTRDMLAIAKFLVRISYADRFLF